MEGLRAVISTGVAYSCGVDVLEESISHIVTAVEYLKAQFRKQVGAMASLLDDEFATWGSKPGHGWALGEVANIVGRHTDNPEAAKASKNDQQSLEQSLQYDHFLHPRRLSYQAPSVLVC